MYFVIAAAKAGSEEGPSAWPPGSAGVAAAALQMSLPLSALTHERVLPATVVVAPALVQGVPIFAGAEAAAFGAVFVVEAFAPKVKLERARAAIAVTAMIRELPEVSFM